MAKRRSKFDYECHRYFAVYNAEVSKQNSYIYNYIYIQDRRLCASFIFFHCELHIEEKFTCAFIQNHAIYDFVRDGIRVYYVHQWNEYQTLYSIRSIRLESLLYMFTTMVCLILHNVQ